MYVSMPKPEVMQASMSSLADLTSLERGGPEQDLQRRLVGKQCDKPWCGLTAFNASSGTKQARGPGKLEERRQHFPKMSVEVQSQTVPMLLVRMSKAKDNISSQSRRDLPNYYAISVALITSYNKFINQQPQHMTSQHCHTGFLRLYRPS